MRLLDRVAKRVEDYVRGDTDFANGVDTGFALAGGAMALFVLGVWLAGVC